MDNNKHNNGVVGCKDDDVDLEALIEEMHCGDHKESNSNFRYEPLTNDDGIKHKSGVNEKRFLKSLPISIFSRSGNSKLRKQHRSANGGGGHELDMSSSAPQHTCHHHHHHHNHVTPHLHHHHRHVTSSSYFSTSLSATTLEDATMSYSVFVSDVSSWHQVHLSLSSTCAQLIEKLLIKLDRRPNFLMWSLVEQNTDNWTERIVEDNEVMDDVVSARPQDAIIRLCLNKSQEKYVILRNPELCLPHGMLTLPEGYDHKPDDVGNVERMQLQHILTKTAPEICGYLSVREPSNKTKGGVWKRLYCVLRNSGLYYSSKKESKDVQHLMSIAEVHSSHVCYSISSKKQHCQDAPTQYSFCLKPRSYENGAKDRWLCAESKQLFTAWVSSLRLTMNGNDFYNSFVQAQRSNAACHITRSSSEKSIYNERGSNFAAMDFSGVRGRIITDQLELANFNTQQQNSKIISSSWRRKANNHVVNRIPQPASVPRNVGFTIGGCLNNNNNGSSTHQVNRHSSAYIAVAMHQGEPWFFPKLTRDEANEHLCKLGNVDGTFLVRDSSNIVRGVVLTVVFKRKPQHVPVCMMERHGEVFYTSDKGITRFETLIHFVDFHRLNKGSLPCPLVYECSRKSHHKYSSKTTR